jgi:hypothetical protein
MGINVWLWKGGPSVKKSFVKDFSEEPGCREGCGTLECLGMPGVGF